LEYLTFGATPKTGAKTSQRGDLFPSNGLAAGTLPASRFWAGERAFTLRTDLGDKGLKRSFMALPFIHGVGKMPNEVLESVPMPLKRNAQALTQLGDEQNAK
jgi:hypothetical protein